MSESEVIKRFWQVRQHVTWKVVVEVWFYHHKSRILKINLIKTQGRVLLKFLNPNLDVNVDVDVNPFKYFYRQNSRKLRLRLLLDLRPLVKLCQDLLKYTQRRALTFTRDKNLSKTEITPYTRKQEGWVLNCYNFL